MNKKVKLHIKKMQTRATLSLVAIISTVISIWFGILFMCVPSYVAVAFFAVALTSIAYLLYSNHSAKYESKATNYKPITITSDRNLSFEKTVTIFESLTDKENQLSTSDDVRFFRLNKIFKLRSIIYKTDYFNKKDFDNAKDSINKKANKELNISPSVNRYEAVKMMRFNIICTNILNDSLYKFISQNANHNLTRVEGIINIAIVGNQIIIPPIYGPCDLMEIRRYKSVIKFINQFMLKE